MRLCSAGALEGFSDLLMEIPQMRSLLLLFLLCGVACGLGEVSYRFRDGHQSRSAPFYKAEVHYPVLIGLRERVLAVFNRAAREHAQQCLEQFVQDASKMHEDFPDAPGADEQFLTLNYQVKYQSDKLLAVLSQGTRYVGAAHPEKFSKVLLFDVQEGKEMKPSDLFVDGTDYRAALGPLVREDLLSRAEALHTSPAMVESGIGSPDDWSCLWPAEKELCVLFEAGTVAPRVAGEVIVKIPYSKLQGSWRTELFEQSSRPGASPKGSPSGS